MSEDLGARVLTLTAEVRDLQQRFAGMEQRLGALKGRFAAQEERLTRMLTLLVRVAERIDETPA